MSFIKIPEAVTNITNNNITAAKSIEVTDLETHVMVCSLRYEALEDRIARLELKVNDMILQSAAGNRLIIRTLLTIGTGVVTAFLATHFKFI